MGTKSKLSDAEKLEVVLMLIRGEEPLSVLARRYGVSEPMLCHWRDEFVEGGVLAMARGARQKRFRHFHWRFKPGPAWLRYLVPTLLGACVGVINYVVLMELLDAPWHNSPLTLWSAVVMIVGAFAVPVVLAIWFFCWVNNVIVVGDDHTRCGKCGYILHGLSEPRCPECGQRL